MRVSQQKNVNSRIENGSQLVVLSFLLNLLPLFYNFQICLNNMGWIRNSQNLKLDPEKIIPDPQHCIKQNIFCEQCLFILYTLHKFSSIQFFKLTSCILAFFIFFVEKTQLPIWRDMRCPAEYRIIRPVEFQVHFQKKLGIHHKLLLWNIRLLQYKGGYRVVCDRISGYFLLP